MNRDDAETTDLARALLGADSPAALAQPLLAALGASADDTLAWSVRWPNDLQTEPDAHAARLDPTSLRRALEALRENREADDAIAVLCDDHEACVAVLAGPVALRFRTLPAAVRQLWQRRMHELLQGPAHRLAVTRAEHAERMQRALFAIADITGSDLDPADMLRGLQRILGELMPAEQLEAVAFDPARKRVHWLHGGNVGADRAAPDNGNDLALDDLTGTPVEEVIRAARPLQVAGPPAWLGVPMLRDGRVQGALVVQAWHAGARHGTADVALLAFVAEQLQTVLERRRQLELLERRVEDRTRALEDSNRLLRVEVAERQRGERLQAALYRIATLAGQSPDSDTFFREVHGIIGGLLDARNFYVALLSSDGSMLSFPYVVDERMPQWPTRPPARGLTEYVLRSGQVAIVDAQRARALAEAGEIEPVLANVADDQWLGAPLRIGQQVFGVVAVQSYDPRVRFDADDADLLGFAANQLAASLQRHRDSSDRQRAQQQAEHLRRQALHDALTGLANRIVLAERLDHAIAAARRDGHRFALLYLDIDHFKQINDQHGHLAGDEVLRQVAGRLGASVREPDLVARLSGDEFAVLLEGLPATATAVEVAERIREEMHAPMRIGSHTLTVSLSIGVSVWSDALDGADAMLQRADGALYRAKQEGRNRYVVAEPA